MTVEMIWEDGVLKPLQPLTGLVEHQRVQITLATGPVESPSARLETDRERRQRILNSLIGTLTEEEAAEMERVIEEEFERIEENG